MALERLFLLLPLIATIACTKTPTATAPPGATEIEEVAVPPKPAPDVRWPRTIEEVGNTFVVYQPQVEKWENDILSARSAVSITVGNKKSFAVIWLTARTDVDKEQRLVTLTDPKIERISYPADPARSEEYLAMLRQNVTAKVRVISLDHLETALAANENATAAEQLTVQNDPPDIIVVSKPSLLVLIDGEPVLRQAEDSIRYMRVLNTRALILLDISAKRYYLTAFGEWVTSPAPTGPWTPTRSAPLECDRIKAQLAEAGTIDLLEPNQTDALPKEPPEVLTRTKPAELIQLSGAAEYTPIPGTDLYYAKNTDSPLFMDIRTSNYIVLASGRWFSSKSFEGPWTYIAGKDLPADFAKIPADHPKANVLVSVPGTPQAKEAVIANSIPQTATVTIAESKLDVTYDGTPELKPVDGAPGLQYVVNTSLPVIYIQAEKTYWCVEDGVWFYAVASSGPWTVATTVPPIIYTIPVSSPLHYVTYVRVYGTAPGVVYVGYTPGYMGTVVTTDNVVVYGTGYTYPAYVGATWVGYPPTYGYGAGFACGATTGFAFGFAAGAVWGNCWVSPYWGPAWGYSHVDLNSESVYRNRRGGVTYANRSYEYDSWTGDQRREGSARSFNPYSGRASAGGYETEYNRYTDEFEAKRAGATYNPRTGVVRGGGMRAEGDLDEPGEGSVDRGQFRYNTRTNTGVANVDGDVYAGRDGNVYRRQEGGGWEKYNDGEWNSTERSQNFQQNRQNLESTRASREAGQQRVESYQGTGRGSANRSAPARADGSRAAAARESGVRSAPSRQGGTRSAPSRAGGARGGGGRRR